MVNGPREACSKVNRTTSFVLVGRVLLHMHGMYPFEDAHDCFFGCVHTYNLRIPRAKGASLDRSLRRWVREAVTIVVRR